MRSLRLEPGDVVVVETEENLTDAAAHLIKSIVREKFVDHQVLVLAGGAHIGVLRLATNDG